MQDSLFSPLRQPAGPGGPRVEGVSRVVHYIQRIIAENKTLATLRVRGEVSELNRSPAGHIYFNLKENADILKCVVWASNAEDLAPFKNGDEVIVAGEFGTYPQRSVYQLYVAELEHTGIGKLYAQFEALKEKFRREGLFEPARKRQMPQFPLRVALVSAAGKGAEDFLTTLGKRAPQISVDFVETRVQGDGAEIEIADAIDRAGRLKPDVIVVARGGGSYEDLFPFNLEPVVRAIVRAKVPVLSAIGHTGDRHVSDLVADKTCETPSNAAQFFGEIRDAYLGRVERARRQLEHGLRGVLGTRVQRFDYAQGGLSRIARNFTAEGHQRLVAFERRLDAQTPKRRLDERARRLQRATSQLDAARPHLFTKAQQRLRDASALLSRVSEPLRRANERWRILSAQLDAVDPRKPLERGYAIVTRDGKPLHDAASVAPGALIEAQLQRGSLFARVESVGQPAQESER